MTSIGWNLDGQRNASIAVSEHQAEFGTALDRLATSLGAESEPSSGDDADAAFDGLYSAALRHALEVLATHHEALGSVSDELGSWAQMNGVTEDSNTQGVIGLDSD